MSASAFHREHVLPAGDVCAHLFVGTELSYRGQSSLWSPDPLRRLRSALSGAVRVRLQRDENDFRCGDQTTGQLFKAAACAQLVAEHAATLSTPYALVAIVRPDLVYGSPLSLPNPRCLAEAGGLRGGWFAKRGEVTLMPFASLGAFRALVHAPCRSTACNASYVEVNRHVVCQLKSQGLLEACQCLNWTNAVARPAKGQ